MVLLTGAALVADEPAPEKMDAKQLKLHRDEARRWEIFVDATRTKRAEFVSEPVYRWTNVSCAQRSDRSDVRLDVRGASRGAGGGLLKSGGGGPSRHHARVPCPRAVSDPAVDSPIPSIEWLPGPACLCTRFPTRRPPRRPPSRRRNSDAGHWPANSPLIRLTMSECAGNCDCYPVRFIGTRSPRRDLIDGALFAFVSDAGTDPEIVLVLEAVKNGEKATWQYRSRSFLDLRPVRAIQGEGSLDVAPGSSRRESSTIRTMPTCCSDDRLVDEFPELDQNKGKGP